jgi:uncharacterized protein (TIGR00288 family)
MTAQFARTPYRGRSGGSTIAEPHAALLIDFDNVTMGIRSDLTKELKNLLNSDIIKGKVAVQRAYADWRRYPQYIVPLAESSVDLIFAPAYGSAKKNATDIRLAIDALELVFTRSEIGTFILLSGDSDFSSLVLKLKEYGKYVIGVGIRESASDLLVQNCDEYYSYSALTGLTRAGEEAPAVSEDPWELVEMALKQMIENDDVMRSDRLKQVLLEMDPTFDEKALGFQKFNKFLQEAASRGLLSLRKQDNGQFEVGPPSPDGAEPTDASTEPREGRRGRGRRGRGRREDVRPREERRDQLELSEAEALEKGSAAPETATAPAPVVAEPEVAPVAAEADTKAARPERERPARPSRPQADEGAAAPVDGARAGSDLAAAYSLLRRAATDLIRKNGPAARDSDVKRRMLELETGWDETTLGFSKFSRFLRQAHDAEVITLRKLENGNYDVLLSDVAPEVEESRGRGRDRGRGRREERGRSERPARDSVGPIAPTPAVEPGTPEVAAVDAGIPRATQATPPARTGRSAGEPAGASQEKTAEQAPRAEGQPVRTGPATPAQPAALGFRRGSRGRGAPSGPPPLLEGQAPRVPAVTEAKPAVSSAAPAAEKPAAAPAEKRSRPAKKSGRKAPETERKNAAPATRFDAAALGLPRDPAEVVTYIAANYKGVGPKSVQALIEKFGAGRVFEALETRPDEVREVMGGARGDRLLEAWSDDVALRRANRPGGAGELKKTAAAETSRKPRKAAQKSRTGRGRRGQPAGK